MRLQILGQTFAVCKLDEKLKILDWAQSGDFFSISRTASELSIVCEENNVPKEVNSERGWKILKVEGTLDFNLTGILVSIAEPLAKAKISIFAVSTFDTDYILVKATDLSLASETLTSKGFVVLA
ncbi:MAG TPA: ACT domain-containing protein [Bacteriovoracaceae bacterium]|nr:ACT domain-containing protein [Bacteriovoracaceae bacterium]